MRQRCCLSPGFIVCRLWRRAAPRIGKPEMEPDPYLELTPHAKIAHSYKNRSRIAILQDRPRLFRKTAFAKERVTDEYRARIADLQD